MALSLARCETSRCWIVGRPSGLVKEWAAKWNLQASCCCDCLPTWMKVFQCFKWNRLTGTCPEKYQNSSLLGKPSSLQPPWVRSHWLYAPWCLMLIFLSVHLCCPAVLSALDIVSLPVHIPLTHAPISWQKKKLSKNSLSAWKFLPGQFHVCQIWGLPQTRTC